MFSAHVNMEWYEEIRSYDNETMMMMMVMVTVVMMMMTTTWSGWWHCNNNELQARPRWGQRRGNTSTSHSVARKVTHCPYLKPFGDGLYNRFVVIFGMVDIGWLFGVPHCWETGWSDLCYLFNSTSLSVIKPWQLGNAEVIGHPYFIHFLLQRTEIEEPAQKQWRI